MLTPLVTALMLAQGAPAAVAPGSAKKPPLVVAPKKVVLGARALAFAAAPTGSKFAATMEDRTVRVFDATTGATLKTLEGHPQPAYAIAWSADGAYLATGDESARIFIWDTRTWARVREMRSHIRGIQALSFNYPRSLLLSTGKDDVIKVWDVATGKELKSIPGEGANFYSASFRGKTNDFGTGILGYGARFYTAPSGKVMTFLTGHDNQGVLDIDFNPAGTLAVTGGKDANAAVWDVKTAKRLNYLRGSGDWVVHCQFSPNGVYAATGSSDRTVRVYDAKSYAQVALLEDQSAVGSPLCFTADGNYLVTVNFDDFLQINTLTPSQPPAPEAKAKPVAKKKKR